MAHDAIKLVLHHSLFRPLDKALVPWRNERTNCFYSAANVDAALPEGIKALYDARDATITTARWNVFFKAALVVLALVTSVAAVSPVRKKLMARDVKGC